MAGCAGAGEIQLFVVPAFIGGDEDVSAFGGGKVAQECEDVCEGEVIDEFFADDEVGLFDGLLGDVGVLESQRFEAGVGDADFGAVFFDDGFYDIHALVVDFPTCGEDFTEPDGHPSHVATRGVDDVEVVLFVEKTRDDVGEVFADLRGVLQCGAAS